MPFPWLLLRVLRVHEVARADEVDGELDRAATPAADTQVVAEQAQIASPDAPASNNLWWEFDPQLWARFGGG